MYMVNNKYTVTPIDQFTVTVQYWEMNSITII